MLQIRQWFIVLLVAWLLLSSNLEISIFIILN
jgi:hypothetical protein